MLDNNIVVGIYCGKQTDGLVTIYTKFSAMEQKMSVNITGPNYIVHNYGNIIQNLIVHGLVKLHGTCYISSSLVAFYEHSTGI